MSATVVIFLTAGSSGMRMCLSPPKTRIGWTSSELCPRTVNTKGSLLQIPSPATEWLDDFSGRIDKPTFVVLDNASIHRKGEVARKIPEWRKRGLYIFYFPPYSPHLKIAETVWRFPKGRWLKPHHYCSRSTLHEATGEILDGIGSEYVINFSHAA
ncbi:MAG: hypothetical protein HDR88_01700 [Bacteroides sp.]|nr:hypothetical protein [Bacteroides sp.]